MIKAIISDLGRVVLDFDHHICTGRLAQLCKCSEEEIFDFIYLSKADIKFDKGEMSPEDFFERIKIRFNMHINFNEFAEIFTDIFSLNPPVAKLLTELKQKYTLCLLSNTNVLHYEFCEKKFDILKIFNHKVLSYRLHVMKPHPKIYMEAVKLCKVKPEECVYIDDIGEFSEAASLLKIHGIQYVNIEELKQDLVRVHAYI